MKQVTFLARFHDGDQAVRGNEFTLNGCAYVVHKGRDPHEKHYFVSQKDTGLQVNNVKATTQKGAVEQVISYLGRSSPTT